MRLHDGLDEWAQNREHGFYPHPVNGREGTVLLRLSAARLRSLERWALWRRFGIWWLAKMRARALQAGASTPDGGRQPGVDHSDEATT